MKHTEHQCQDSHLKLGTTGCYCPWQRLQWQWAQRWLSVCTDFRITACCTCSLVKGLSALLSVAQAQRRPICPLSFVPVGRQSKLLGFIPTVEPLQGVESAWRSWVTNLKPLFVRTKTAGNPKVTGQWTRDWLRLALNWMDMIADYIFLVFLATFCQQRLTKSSSSDITHSIMWLIYLPSCYSLPQRVNLSLTEPVRDRP